MFDATIRPWIDLTFNPLGRRLAQQGATADQVTIAGFALGLGSAFAIAAGQFKLSLTLIALNRVCDGLDGAIARATRPTDRGGFLDIVLDFVFYASVPLAFAFHDPAHNAVAAAALIAAFLANGGAFLAYAAAAAKRGITTTAQGSKSIYYMAGMAEGAETVLVFCAFCLWPEAFSWLAIAFAGMRAIGSRTANNWLANACRLRITLGYKWRRPTSALGVAARMTHEMLPIGAVKRIIGRRSK